MYWYRCFQEWWYREEIEQDLQELERSMLALIRSYVQYESEKKQPMTASQEIDHTNRYFKNLGREMGIYNQILFKLTQYPSLSTEQTTRWIEINHALKDHRFMIRHY